MAERTSGGGRGPGGRGLGGRAASLLTTTSRGPLAGAAVGVAERLAPWRDGVVAMLTYHRVDDPAARPDLWPGLVSATPDEFATQVRALTRRYTPVSMAQILDAVDEPRRLPRRAVHVTFDDAYVDFAIHAWPVLRAAGVPVTLFVPTAYPDVSGAAFWWDRIWRAISGTASRRLPEGLTPKLDGLPLEGPDDRTAATGALLGWLKSLPHERSMAHVAALEHELTPGATDALATDATGAAAPAILSWATLRQLAAEGVTLAGHTRTHPLLDQVPVDVATAEVAGAFDDLRREVGSTPPVLAYPSGAHGGAAPEAAQRAGMVLAVTTKRGGNDLRHVDRMRVRRINVGGRSRSPLIRAELMWASLLDARRR